MLRRLVAICVAILAQTALAEAPAPDASIQTVEVAPGIYMLIGKGGNIGVSTGADGTFLIDDQYAPMTPAVIAALKAVNAPMPATTAMVWGASTNRAFERATMYTPAVTIVAA